MIMTGVVRFGVAWRVIWESLDCQMNRGGGGVGGERRSRARGRPGGRAAVPGAGNGRCACGGRGTRMRRRICAADRPGLICLPAYIFQTNYYQYQRGKKLKQKEKN